ncbi:MAG: hypothetical protein AAF334_09605 [Pseudomonadota bacterium]
MRFFARSVLVAALIAGLSACSGGGGPDNDDGEGGTFLSDVGTLWGAESRQTKRERLERERLAAIKVPVSSVGAVEMGRTRDGFLITAKGTAPGLGYSRPQLRPRRSGEAAADGYIEFDFVATPPPEGFDLPPGTTQTRAVRADFPVRIADLQGKAGIRILGENGGTQVDF